MIEQAERPKLSIYDRYPELKEIEPERFPTHITIIPDGNRTFGRAAGGEGLDGHKAGVQTSLAISRDLREIEHIKFLTLWGFSTDNWERGDEVPPLLDLLSFAIAQHSEELHQNNVRFIHLGRKDRIPLNLRQVLTQSETKTHHNTGQTLSIGIDFGGDDQIFRMIEAARFMPAHKELTIEDIASLRDGQGRVPPADLLIRTSQRRPSDVGWLLGKQTEVRFLPDLLYPQLTTDHVVEQIVDFSKTERRMGR